MSDDFTRWLGWRSQRDINGYENIDHRLEVPQPNQDIYNKPPQGKPKLTTHRASPPEVFTVTSLSKQASVTRVMPVVKQKPRYSTPWYRNRRVISIGVSVVALVLVLNIITTMFSHASLPVVLFQQVSQLQGKQQSVTAQSRILNASDRVTWLDDASRSQYLTDDQWNNWSWGACFSVSMTVVANAWGGYQIDSHGIIHKTALITGQVLDILSQRGLISESDGWLNTYISKSDPNGFYAGGNALGYKVDVHYKDGNFDNLAATVNSGKPAIADAYKHWFVIYKVDANYKGHEQTTYVYLVDPNRQDDHTWAKNFHARRVTVYEFENSYWHGTWLIYTPKFKI